MELMVAIVITGMMTAAGYSAFASVIDHRRTMRAATERIERAAALREQIDAWLATGQPQLQQGGGPTGSSASSAAGRAAGRGASPTTGAPGASTRTGVMDAMTNTAAAAVSADADLTLTTTALTPSMAPSTRLRLYVDGDLNTPERGLCIEYQLSPQTPLARRELDPSVTAMTVEFLDGTTHRWIAASQAGTTTPLAIRVTLSGADAAGTESLPPILRLPIIRGVGDQSARAAPTGGLAR